MRVSLHSAKSRIGDLEGNIAAAARHMATDADLVVLPEMFLSGYNIGDGVHKLALRPDDARLRPLEEAAAQHGTHLVAGAPVSGRDGVVHNSALCLAPGKAPHWVHKRALATFTTFREGLYFARGPPQGVWRTALGTFGLSICYDLYFPELQKRQVLQGADVLVNISASPSVSRRFFEAVLVARAIENASFSLYSNNVGAQDGIVFWGGARGYGPRGDLLGEVAAYEEGSVVVDLDLADLRAARAFRPTLRDSDEADLKAVEA